MPQGYYVRATPEERLKRRLVVAPSGCHEWTGSPDSNGYGRIRVNGRVIGTHKFAWELVNGPVPSGMKVLHHCDNRRCCNVEKCLFLGTSAVNTADMIAKGRESFRWQSAKTRCKRNHLFSEANTYMTSNGSRQCRACRRYLYQLKVAS